MRLLLDTHALLWWLGDDERLGPRVRDVISDPDHDVLVSAVSLWEIAVKVRIGKLKADTGEIVQAVEQGGFTSLGIEPAHLAVLGNLPLHPDHRDPFDHLLVAQAIAEGATFISADRNVPRYPVPFIPCTDRAAPSPPG